MAKDDTRVYEDACVIIGFNDGNPIWKKVGIKTKTKSSNRDVVLIDRTFNPAGCPTDEASKTSVPVYFFPQDKDRERFKGVGKTAVPQNSFSDFEDDIPF